MISIKGQLISTKLLLRIRYLDDNEWYGNRICFEYRDGNEILIQIKDYAEYENICNLVLDILTTNQKNKVGE